MYKRQYLDGSFKFLSPEKSIEIQRNLGADLILVFDECTPFHVDKSYTESSMRRSHRWATRSLYRFNSHIKFKPNFGSAGDQKLYSIVQGGIYEDLREESIDFNLNKIDTFGIAIGGSLGSSKEEMYKVVNFTAPRLGNKHPIHLLGIGDPKDIWHLVKSGIDTFDCVSPTRLARHGSALIKGNDYSEVLPIYTNDSIDSYYINELKAAKTFIEAKTIYEQQKKYINTLSVPYYFECYDYFSSWDRSYAYSILTSLASLAKDNPKALKALAFKMEEIGKLEDAKIIYQYLLDIRPSDCLLYTSPSPRD